MRRILTVVAILAVALYIAYWFVVARGVEDGAERWVAEARERGETVEFGAMEVGGFPLDVTLAVEALRYAWRQDGASAGWTGGFDASAWLGAPDRIEVAFSGRQIVTVDPEGPDGPLEIAWPSPSSAELVTGGDGRLSEARFRADQVTVTDIGTGSTYTADTVTLDAVRTTASEDDPPAMLVDTLVEGVTLPAETAALLGRRVERVELSADMTHPPVLGGETFDPERWRAAGGTLFVRELRVAWAGVKGEASGELQLDGRLQPAGTLQLSLTGYDKALDAAVAAGQIAAKDARTLRGMLDLFASTGADGARTVSAPMTIRDGGVYVGPLLVAELPPVDWAALQRP